MQEKRAQEDFRVRQFAAVSPPALPTGAGKVPPPAAQLEHIEPDSGRVILHFDADCFYCQCEELRDPSLQDKPLGELQQRSAAAPSFSPSTQTLSPINHHLLVQRCSRSTLW